MSKKLLVLDMDETLIHTSTYPLVYPVNFRFHHFYVYFRPHLKEFIAGVLPLFDVGIWTAGGELYARPIIEQIFPKDSLRFFWSRNRCTFVRDWRHHDAYDIRKRIKKVKRLGYRLESVIAVDDAAERYESYGNLVVVKPFLGAQDDDELLLLLAYLKQLNNVPNVRTVEKRNWRSEVCDEKGFGS